MSVLDRVAGICGRDLDDRNLRRALLAELRGAVPFDAYAWLLTDPETCVGVSPLAEVPVATDLPALIRLKYLTPTNRWTGLPTDTAMTLVGDRSTNPMWHELLAALGVDDVASTVFRDQYGCWGFLDLWRFSGSFESSEIDLLGRYGRAVTPGLRRSLARTFAYASPGREAGPAVLVLAEDLEPLTQTPSTDAYLRALLPTDADRAPVPAAAYNVAAQLLAHEAGVDVHPPWARVHVRDGMWMTLRAARMTGSIAVSIEPTPADERVSLYARVLGLSEREAELLGHLVAGCDTHQLADRMFLSAHTVQDHLKSIFAKTDTNSRRVLVSRATGAG